MRIHINASGMGVKMDDVETLFFLHVAQVKKFDSLSGIVCLQNRIAKQRTLIPKRFQLVNHGFPVVFVSLLGYHFLAL